MNPWAAVVGSGAARRDAAALVVAGLRSAGLRLAGGLQVPVYDDELCLGYDLIDLSNDERTPLARVGPNPELCDFTFDPAGFEAVLAWCKRPADVVFVDVGKLERAGGGHSQSVHEALHGSEKIAVLSIRSSVVAPVVLGLSEDPFAGLEVPCGAEEIDGFVSAVAERARAGS